LRVEGGYFIVISIKNHLKNIPTKYFYNESTEIENKDSPINCLYTDLQNPDVNLLN